MVVTQVPSRNYVSWLILIGCVKLDHALYSVLPYRYCYYCVDFGRFFVIVSYPFLLDT